MLRQLPSRLASGLERAFENKLAELHVRQSLAIEATYGDSRDKGSAGCLFCDEPASKHRPLCQSHWDGCVAEALASIRQARELRRSQRQTVERCPHCQDGPKRYACSHCAATGRLARTGYVFCSDCHGGGLKYGHTPCVRCGQKGIFTEAAFYAALAPAQAKALREQLAADGISELRHCQRLTDMGEWLHVDLFLAPKTYKRYAIAVDGQVNA